MKQFLIRFMPLSAEDNVPETRVSAEDIGSAFEKWKTYLRDHPEEERTVLAIEQAAFPVVII